MNSKTLIPSNESLITLSIVSHGQWHLVSNLLRDLESLFFNNFEVILTINIPENIGRYNSKKFMLKIIKNKLPKGFGANHNEAFKQSSGKYFAVVNPDIRIPESDLFVLLSAFDDNNVGVAGPLVVSESGSVEDSARISPSFIGLAKRFFLKERKPDYQHTTGPIEVDWIAGMFMMFRAEAFKEVGGFDEKRFFMYLEDADICKRLQSAGWMTLYYPAIRVIHVAQRASHRNLKYFRWHVTSALRYLTGF